MNTRVLNGAWRVLLALVFCISLAGIPTHRAKAGTYAVSNLNDSGEGSLRMAIDHTNSTPGADTLIFSVNGSILLGSSLPQITDDLTIDGSGRGIEIIGASLFGTIRLMTIAAGVNVTLNELYISDGDPAIYNEGNLSIMNCSLTSNHASPTDESGGAIYNTGTLTVVDSWLGSNHASSIDGSGGAIYNTGTLTVVDSHFYGNSAHLGGGIYNGGPGPNTLVVRNSTFYQNHASWGGAIFNDSTTNIMMPTIAKVVNSTFYKNEVEYDGGGIENNFGTLYVINSTFSLNKALTYGGGIYNNSGIFHLKNTILANSVDAHDCYSSNLPNSNINNLIESSYGCGTPLLSADPMFGPFDRYGGSTSILPLIVGSPAIDVGDDATCAADPVNNLDQRGVVRPQGPHCDIGSYENTNHAPTDISLSKTSVAENQPAGTKVGTLTTTDPDAGDTFIYSFCGGVDDGFFRLSGNNLQTNAIFNYEADSSYEICIRTRDSFHTTLDKNFTITVTDLFEGTTTFHSTGAQDGWVLESTENSNIGGSMNNSSTTLLLGDDVARKQYRSILSFATGGLPDNAIITKVTLRVRRQGVIGGGNPVTTFQGFYLDIRKGTFGTSALQVTDWQAAAHTTIGPFTPALTAGWYIFNLTSVRAYINKLATLSGLTQVRLRFKLDDNNNAIANYLSLYSGNVPLAYRPQLIVEYYVP